MPIHQVTCPYCHCEFFIESPMGHIFMARRKCQGCGREFLIKDGVATKDESQD